MDCFAARATTESQGLISDAICWQRLFKPTILHWMTACPSTVYSVSNREAVLQAIKAKNKKLVTLSGDSHNAWFANLTTLAGEKVGVEFAASSVTAPGFESVGLGSMASSLDGSALVPQLGASAIGAGLGLVDDLNYSDSIRRGYLLMTITADAVKGEYVFVSTVKSSTYTAAVGKTVTVAATGAVSYA